MILCLNILKDIVDNIYKSTEYYIIFMLTLLCIYFN